MDLNTSFWSEGSSINIALTSSESNSILTDTSSIESQDTFSDSVSLPNDDHLNIQEFDEDANMPQPFDIVDEESYLGDDESDDLDITIEESVEKRSFKFRENRLEKVAEEENEAGFRELFCMPRAVFQSLYELIWMHLPIGMYLPYRTVSTYGK